jgi:Tfp pilus assembly protein FimT
LSAVAVPRLFDDQSFRERGYVDELASTLRYARAVAISSDCAVSVDLQANGYAAHQRLSLTTCNSSSAWSRQVRRGDGSALAGTAPSGIALTPQTIIFDQNGDVANGQPAPVAVGAFTLTVDRLGGVVTVTP